MRKDCTSLPPNIPLLLIPGGNNEDKKHNFGNDSSQIVPRKGESKLLESLPWHPHNKQLASCSTAKLPTLEQLWNGWSLFSPEVPMNWLPVQGVVTRRYWRANSVIVVKNEAQKAQYSKAHSHDCWNVGSSGAGRKGKGAAEREAMGGKSDRGCFMSV